MDFGKLPSSYDLLMFNDYNKRNSEFNDNEYKLGNSLFDTILEKFDDSYNIDQIYNDITSSEYSTIEEDWVFDWLKNNKFDGAFIIETQTINLLIFNPKHLKIINTIP